VGDDLADAMVAALPSLERFARTLARDPASAEDLVQETVARALERSGQFRGDASVRTWLHRILFHLAVDGGRREARSRPAPDVADEVERRWRDDAWTVDAATVVERAEIRAELEDALVHLSVDQRVAVLLHDVEGLTSREVAEVTGVGVPAAKQRLRRGRMALVTALARGAELRTELRAVPLRCWDARSLVSDYLDGELSRPDAAAVEGHLTACPTCPPLYGALVGTTAGLGRLRDPDSVVDARLAERIRAHLRDGGAGADRPRDP
jgi:RNA polymerase sigma-70 factor (ECF subfamily)